MTCEHLKEAERHAPNAEGCEECLKTGGEWVALRVCTTCGHVGCCDSSPGKHATAHYHKTKHPVIEAKDGSWRWCYVHEEYLPLED